jgi:hypothetical protein
MLGIRPSKKELEQMSCFQLYDGLITNRSYASLFLVEINARMIKAGVSDSRNLALSEYKNKTTPPQTPAPTPPPPAASYKFWPDIKPAYIQVQTGGSFSILSEQLLSSSWDFKDRRGLMNKPPKEYRGFIESLQLHNKSYSDLNLSQCGLLATIIDAYRYARDESLP